MDRCQSFSSNSARRLAVIWSPAWRRRPTAGGRADPRVDVAALARQVGALLLDLWGFRRRIGRRPRPQLLQSGIQLRQFRRQFLRYQLGRVLDAHGFGAKVAQRRIVLRHRFDAGLYPVQIGVSRVESFIGTGLGECGSQGDPEETED